MNICKTKTLRTNQLYVQDNYKTLIQNTKRRFEKIVTNASKKHPYTFSYNQTNKQTNPMQGICQTPQTQIFLSRFSTNPSQSNAVANFSSSVTNAMQAVAVACRQQQQQNTTQVTPEQVIFKTPKFLAEMKIAKERQNKTTTQTPSTITAVQTQQTQQLTPILQAPTQQEPAQQQAPQQQQQQQQQQQAQSSQQTVISKIQQQNQNQTILSQLQQQKATNALAAHLAATAAAAAAATNETRPQQAVSQPTTKPSNQTIANTLRQQQQQQQQQLAQQLQSLQQVKTSGNILVTSGNNQFTFQNQNQSQPTQLQRVPSGEIIGAQLSVSLPSGTTSLRQFSPNSSANSSSNQISTATPINATNLAPITVTALNASNSLVTANNIILPINASSIISSSNVQTLNIQPQNATSPQIIQPIQQLINASSPNSTQNNSNLQNQQQNSNAQSQQAIRLYTSKKQLDPFETLYWI